MERTVEELQKNIENEFQGKRRIIGAIILMKIN